MVNCNQTGTPQLPFFPFCFSIAIVVSIVLGWSMGMDEIVSKDNLERQKGHVVVVVAVVVAVVVLVVV